MSWSIADVAKMSGATARPALGTTAVQVVWSRRKGSRSIEHIGSAHDDVELAALKAAAATRLTAGQTELDLGLSGSDESGTLPITSSHMTHLWEGLCSAYRTRRPPRSAHQNREPT